MTTPETHPHEEEARARTTLWALKILSQLTLLVYICIDAALGLPPDRLLSIQPLWFTAFVPIPALSNILHYLILKRHAGDSTGPARLVTDRGLFRVVRHPMYLGDILMVLLFMFAWLDVVTVVLAPLSIASIVLLARKEDESLARTFGALHREWKGRTSLLLPTLTRRKAGASGRNP